MLPHLRNTASRLGLEIAIPPPAFSVYGKPDAIYDGERWVFSGAEHLVDQIIRFPAEQRIPSPFGEAEAAERGATLACGVTLTRELGRAGDQLARVLKGAKAGELPVDASTEYELIDRLAALAPPPRVHRHRYHGVISTSRSWSATGRSTIWTSTSRRTSCARFRTNTNGSPGSLLALETLELPHSNT